jgi:hypothetical protein
LALMNLNVLFSGDNFPYMLVGAFYNLIHLFACYKNATCFLDQLQQSLYSC